MIAGKNEDGRIFQFGDQCILDQTNLKSKIFEQPQCSQRFCFEIDFVFELFFECHNLWYLKVGHCYLIVIMWSLAAYSMSLNTLRLITFFSPLSSLEFRKSSGILCLIAVR